MIFGAAGHCFPGRPTQLFCPGTIKNSGGPKQRTAAQMSSGKKWGPGDIRRDIGQANRWKDNEFHHVGVKNPMNLDE